MLHLRRQCSVSYPNDDDNSYILSNALTKFNSCIKFFFLPPFRCASLRLLSKCKSNAFWLVRLHSNQKNRTSFQNIQFDGCSNVCRYQFAMFFETETTNVPTTQPYVIDRHRRVRINMHMKYVNKIGPANNTHFYAKCQHKYNYTMFDVLSLFHFYLLI